MSTDLPTRLPLFAREAVTGGAGEPRGARWASNDAVTPTIFVAVNAVAFWFLRPGVNDLWAARARADAVSHGVGLFYWFGWFGGGSTPGNYSVITPYLCAWIGTELVGALSAVALAVLITIAVRDTVHPRFAAAVGALGVVANLWSGRIPFLLGGAIAVGAVIALRHRRRAALVGLIVLAILASPVAAVFVALGSSGTFLTTRTRQWRPIIAWAVGATAIAGLAVTLVFGAPGPEPFSTQMVAEVVVGLVILLLARPPDHVRTTIYVAILATLAVAVVPNGLGANIARYGWFCLPVLVAATNIRTNRWLIALGVLPIVLAGGAGTVTDLVGAGQPISTTGYYQSLAGELARVPHLADFRVEVVNHGAHTAYDALLGSASLARGWETQEDNSLNAVLSQQPLDPVTYKVWLDNNAVGWVALPTLAIRPSVNPYPEYTLVDGHRPAYLHPFWRDAHWTLFRVANASPIVAPPATLLGHTQSSMVVRVPCACSVPIRLRFSRYLVATPRSAQLLTSDRAGHPFVPAEITDDGTGWSVLTTHRRGVYVLQGSLSGFLH